MKMRWRSVSGQFIKSPMSVHNINNNNGRMCTVIGRPEVGRNWVVTADYGDLLRIAQHHGHGRLGLDMHVHLHEVTELY